MIKPKDMLLMLSSDPVLSEVAREVEDQTTQMINEAR